MSTESQWSHGAHVCEIIEAHIQIGAVFINKPQIWVLNNYILAWNTHIQCRQTLAVAAPRARCRHGVTHLSRINKATSASDRRPSAPWVLSSAGKLIRYSHGSYFLPQTFYSFVFLSAISIFVAWLGCSLNAFSFISWVDTPPTADWLQVCFGTHPQLGFSKTFLKNRLPCL